MSSNPGFGKPRFGAANAATESQFEPTIGGRTSPQKEGRSGSPPKNENAQQRKDRLAREKREEEAQIERLRRQQQDEFRAQREVGAAQAAASSEQGTRARSPSRGVQPIEASADPILNFARKYRANLKSEAQRSKAIPYLQALIELKHLCLSTFKTGEHRYPPEIDTMLESFAEAMASGRGPKGEDFDSHMANIVEGSSDDQMDNSYIKAVEAKIAEYIRGAKAEELGSFKRVGNTNTFKKGKFKLEYSADDIAKSLLKGVKKVSASKAFTVTVSVASSDIKDEIATGIRASKAKVGDKFTGFKEQCDFVLSNMGGSEFTKDMASAAVSCLLKQYSNFRKGKTPEGKRKPITWYAIPKNSWLAAVARFTGKDGKFNFQAASDKFMTENAVDEDGVAVPYDTDNSIIVGISGRPKVIDFLFPEFPGKAMKHASPAQAAASVLLDLIDVKKDEE